ncbi:hypothetical protein [Neisseria iguanae]|nr:hypothetical protein [Neisseria iguanae]
MERTLFPAVFLWLVRTVHAGQPAIVLFIGFRLGKKSVISCKMISDSFTN